ncbi:MAG: S8 family peptidase [Capsulimonadales bacterium]|nr:S8 family peptidase [Capsulimonadales bacterium]
MKKNLPVTLATFGIVALLGATAMPMLTFRPTDEPPTVPMANVQDVNRRHGFPDVRPGEIVVDLKDKASDAEVRSLETKYGIRLRENATITPDDRIMVANVPASEANALLSKLSQEPLVEAAEPEVLFHLPVNEADTTEAVRAASTLVIEYNDANQGKVTIFQGPSVSFGESGNDGEVMWSRSAPEDGFTVAFKPNDPRFDEQWNFKTIGVEEAWKRSRGKGIVVAVIDTGVSGGNVKRGPACRDFNKTSFVEGYDFIHKSKDAYDDHGHGTHVAGTIAESTNNGEGVTGIAFEASIMPLKVLSAEGWGTSADIADAIRFAADHGANVINMSLGSAYPSDVIHKAVQYAAKKGVVIVCAAGNSFGGPVGYPAAYKECIAVSATGPSGDIAKYSSYGKEVALAAPGGDMVDSRDPSDGILQNTNIDGTDGYYSFNGTSMASPHVAAVAALIQAQGIKDPERVREVLTKTATPKNDAIKYGSGILSAERATARAAQLNGVKLRHLLLPFLGLMLFLVGMGRLNLGLRLAMGGALVAGFFGPDLFTHLVGVNSLWNVIGCSAMLPVIAYALLRKGPGVKVAGALGLGVGVNLYANWHNDTLPFTAHAFGDSFGIWLVVNLVVALGTGLLAAYQAHRATRTA